MNRRELLDRASATAEERLLLGRVWDKYEQCRSRCVPTHTEFLSPQEQAAARRLLQAIGAEESEYAFFGGYEGAERRQLHFLPDWAFGPEEDAAAALRCRFYEAGTLNHRDFLGSLMGLGLTREKIGDILVGENSADVLVSRTAEPFLLEQWESAGRAHLQVAPLALADVTAPAQAQREVRDTVSSLRLDSVLSSGFSISRQKAADAVTAGRVEVNWLACAKPDRAVTEGDVLTVRGLGKCKLTAVGGPTKKGRLPVTLIRYL